MLPGHVLEPLLNMRRDLDHTFDHFFRHSALPSLTSEIALAVVPPIETWIDESDQLGCAEIDHSQDGEYGQIPIFLVHHSERSVLLIHSIWPSQTFVNQRYYSSPGLRLRMP
jgi:hypothetical protein